jgi:hypothetical protein
MLCIEILFRYIILTSSVYFSLSGMYIFESNRVSSVGKLDMIEVSFEFISVPRYHGADFSLSLSLYLSLHLALHLSLLTTSP